MMWTVFLLLCLYNCSSAQATCGYVPPTFAWPLTSATEGLEIVRGSVGNLHEVTSINDKPGNLGYKATMFDSLLGSYTRLHVDDNARADLESAYAFQLYLKPESDGVFLHYRSLDQTPCSKSIISLKARLIAGDIVVSLSNGTITEEQEIGLGLAYGNTWYQLAIGRNATTDTVTVVVNGVEHALVFGAWVGGAVTKGAGQVQVGGSMDGESFISANMACLQLICCENPLGDALYDDVCSTGWPNPFPWDVELRAATPYVPLIVGYYPCFGCPHVQPCSGADGPCVIQ